MWVCRVLLLLIASLVVGCIGLHHENGWWRIAYLWAAVCMAAGSFALLFSLAIVTLKCRDYRPRGESITAYTLRHGGSCEDAAYLTFLTYLQMNGTGIQVSGIPITLGLVLHLT